MLMQFVEVDGVATRYLSAGPEGAPTLLLIHGLTLTCDIWASLIDELARDCRVLAPDMLGHGFTRPHAAPADVDIGAKASHLARFVEMLAPGRPFDISGSSYGALVACNMYLRQPHAIERLVLHGSSSCFSSETQLAAAIERAHKSYAGLLSASDPAGWRDHLTHSVYDTSSIPGQLPHMLALAYAQPWIAPYWNATISAMSDRTHYRRYRVLERLEEIRARTLLVWGLDDPGAPIAAGQAALGRLPDARLSTFERCGHFPMFEHPVAVAETMRDFLAR